MASVTEWEDLVLRRVGQDLDEIVDLAARLIRIPTVNPPGDAYEACARLLAGDLEGFGFQVKLIETPNNVWGAAQAPRWNLVARRAGSASDRFVHFNGHTDVVPPGNGWDLDPFGAQVVDGRLYGRGSADMKAGIAAAVFATECLRRCQVPWRLGVEISATVDEETGGFAGVDWLLREGHIDREKIDGVIIPEPLDPDRVCVGHRGVAWFKITARGRIGHGSMPFWGRNAITLMGPLLHELSALTTAISLRRSDYPIVPEGALHPTLNLNSIHGGQSAAVAPSPCVADSCELVVDRRFLPEEDLESVRREIHAAVARVKAQNEGEIEVEELWNAEPTVTPEDSPLIAQLETAIRDVSGAPARRVLSPGTYDHKHFFRTGGIRDCVAYGPGRLEQAHQPNEWCGLADIRTATQVMALVLLRRQLA